MPNKNNPFHPIIYVRGYAMSRGEIDSTTADPFCGFNLGSTVYRAVPDKNRQPRKYVFESPVVRLAADFRYQDVYEDGYDILDPEWETDAENKPTSNKLTNRSIVVYRYYDEASKLLGTGETPGIETFATNLGELILRVKDLVVKNRENGVSDADFRCYLVAHSMGGLVCRAFLQNPAFDKKNAGKYVDKLFTYATPHNGIEMAGINVPGWLGLNDIDNFNRKYMAKYLNLEEAYKKTGRVDWIPEDRFPTSKVFCMVGTNRTDYEVAAGLSRTFVGHGSDGLVRIENATICGLTPKGEPNQPSAKAFAFRSHSGFFGIVNSEEAFQNLVRFLFGDVRVDIWLDIDEIRLPAAVQREADAKRKVNALYQIEVTASPRGKLWYLTRRIAEEDSVACLSHADFMANPKANRSMFVSTVFLANRAKINPRRRSLAYSVSVGIRVPDYEIDKKLWVNEHYEGGYLFQDAIILEMIPPRTIDEPWKIKYAWQKTGFAPPDTPLDADKIKGGAVELKVPFESEGAPGIRGQLRFIVAAWNPDAVMDD